MELRKQNAFCVYDKVPRYTLPEGEAVQLGLPEEWLEAGKP